MTYPIFINVAYWTLAALIVALLTFIASGGLTLLWLRHRRFARAHRSYLQRVEKRGGRAMEDTCWFLLRGRDARIAETIADAKAVVRVLADVRQSKLEAV